MAVATPHLFEDTFEVQEIDPDGKVFVKVSRIVAHGETYDSNIVLDIHSDLCKLKLADKFKLLLARTIRLDGALDDEVAKFAKWDPRQLKQKTLMDQYDYVMHGKVFKITTTKGAAGGPSKANVFVSFGGLLMGLEGEPKHLQKFELDMRVYLLLRKTR